MGHANHGQGHSEHHIVPFSDYMKVFLVLLVLTVVTVAAAQFDFGPWNTIVAMIIATVKAGLVLAIFMHLKYDDKLNRVIFGSGIFFLLILYGFSIVDILTRINATPK